MRQKKMTELLPEFPRTVHLPWKPNAKSDRIATKNEAAIIFASSYITVQEKVDGANCGMALVDGIPVIRSRSKIISKGRLGGGISPGLAQFSSAFNWFYKNIEKFEQLGELLGPITVYGEWMIQQHGMVYDNLPDWFLPFDVYDQEVGRFIDMRRAYDALTECGFHAIDIDELDTLENYEQLEVLANKPSKYAKDQPREGVYLKVSDGKWITERFKMVREGFKQGCLLDSSRAKTSSRQMKKNRLGS